MREYPNLTKRLVIVSSAIALLCSGCTIGGHRIKPSIGRYDVEPQFRSESFQDVGIAHAPRLVKIDVEYRMWGRNWKSIGRQIRPDIVSGLTANHVFVEADETNADQAGHLHIVVKQDNSAKKFAEVLAKSLITGMTYFVVTTSGDMFYDMDVTYTPHGGPTMTWNCRHPVHTTVGVMAMVQNDNSLAPKDVLPELTEGMAANFALDFVKFSAPTQYADVPAIASNEMRTTTRLNRLPTVATHRSLSDSGNMIRPTVATEPTPNVFR